MKLTGNTILITGGGSGIGQALAVEFHKRGNTVIIAGRRQSALDETVKANPGMHALVMDTGDAASIAAGVAKLTADFPALNAVINNAGIMRPEDLKQGDTATAEATIATNLLGPIRLTAALLPHLLKQPSATVLTVSSGLAFVPMALTATYCATKAAIHSYSQSLRYQLKDTKVRVVEIIPPWVATELMGAKPTDPRAMPLDAYIAETMELLGTDADEILVKNVLPLRNAAKGDEVGFFTKFNDSLPH
ncbi:MAG TPA: SDR family oxidoreductase [Acidobacteriaceae bacterium]|nr:SDR family oxidoreductase [Acidobacteriaceae bacterium]